jgi:hypothetical protein
VPIVVLVVWFAIYFWEVIQVRLKLQEASRFAAWEFTSYPLHDYDGDTGSRFDDYESEVADLTGDLYEDLDSSDRASILGGGNSFLATGWELDPIRLHDETPPDLTGDWMVELGLDVLLTLEAWIESLLTSVTNPYAAGPVLWSTRHVASIDREWGFNTRGFVTVDVRARVNNLMVPERFRGITSLEFENGRWVRDSLRLSEHSGLLADTWRLNDGRDVEHGDTSGGYYEQVNRMYLLDSEEAGTAIALMEALATECWFAPMIDILPNPQEVPDATEPVVVSYNHHVDQDGRVTLQTDGGRQTFDTAPLTVPAFPVEDDFGFEDDEDAVPPYQQVLDNRGEYYMGCEEPMNASCGAGLGTDNPFGDGVHWPPPEGSAGGG